MKILIILLVIGALFESIETNDFDKSQCDPRGIKEPFSTDNEECKCKEFVSGSRCDQCTAETFHLTSENKLGCRRCFCMGVTTNCSSSSWYRNKINASFKNSPSDFSLVMPYQPVSPTITQGLRLNENGRGIYYTGFAEGVESDAIYWQLPAYFLGNKLTSYGGELKYTIYYLSSSQELDTSKEVDVVIINSNSSLRMYHRLDSTPQPNSHQTLTVVLLEEFWTISPSGPTISRENFLMLLTSITTIRVRATYTTRPDVISISDVSLDTATKINTGMERALEVEECNCPIGYVGLSCEECATGYSRGVSALYVGNCELDSSNELGEYEYGETYEIDDSVHSSMMSSVNIEEIIQVCSCEPAGSKSNKCVEGKCQCKVNVDGSFCNVCRSSTFGLSVSNVKGCNKCFCSGVTKECRGSSLYIHSIVPNFHIPNHPFTVVHRRVELPVNNGIEIHSSHEIQYHYDNDRKAVMWSLSSIFTGNQVKSYGGYLEFSQKYESSTVTNFKTSQYVMLKGNGLTLIWGSNAEDLISSKFKNYRVQLRESEWKKKTNPFSTINATRTDLMTALSNVEAIFVVAPYGAGKKSVSIKNVSLDTALEYYDEDTFPITATQVEECTCPLGYTGTSCESCLHGYYREINAISGSVLGRCQPCPCNNREDSCELYGNSQVKCHCAAGYTGDYCQDIESVAEELRPLSVRQAPQEPEVNGENYRHQNGKEGWKEQDGILISPHAQVSEEARGRINSQSSAGGVYICQVDNREASSETPAITELPPSKSPVLTVSPYPDASVILGSSITLHCSAEDRHLKVRWYRNDGRQLAENVVQLLDGSLEITNIKNVDAGVYTCYTINKWGSVSTSVKIKIESIPVIKITPNTGRKYVELGEPVTLTCEAQSNPFSLVSWQMTSSKTRESRQLGQQSPKSNSYKIRSMSQNDEGIYTCMATNPIGSNQGTIEVLVKPVPSNPTTTPKPPTSIPVPRPKLPVLKVYPGTSASALRGDSITLNCTEEVSNLEVHWAREDGRSFTRNIQINGGVLHITNINDDDAGTYLCSTKNEVGSALKSVSVKVHSKPVIEITINPKKEQFELGEHVRLTCEARGHPQPFVDWHMTKSTTGEFKYLGQQTPISNSYEIQSMSKNDEGVYICTATNSVGSDEEHIRLLVVPEEPNPTTTPKPDPIPPKNIKRELEVSKKYLRLPIGQKAEIDCHIVGPDDPQIKLKWEKRGHSLPKNTVLDNGHLVINQVTKDNAGLYTCRARDKDGTQLYKAMSVIKVISAPKILAITPKHQIYNIGATLSVLCRVEGDEPIIIEWSRDGQPLLSNQEYNKYGALKFHEMSSKDVGAYVCNATNKVGSVLGYAEVKLEGSKVQIIALPISETK